MFLEFHWYGLMYVVAFWLGWWGIPHLAKWRNIRLSREQWTEVVVWVAAGVLIGGRLGYVLLYEPSYYSHHVGWILAVGGGGMSSHGGFIGVALALWYVSRRFRIPLLALADAAVIPAALGLALGRVGNFINHELYVGNFALVAAAKDMLIAVVCYRLLKRVPRLRDGQVAGMFFILYAGLRFLTEYLRVPEWGSVWGLTWGQFLTVPILLIGLYLFFVRRPTLMAK